MLKNNKTLLFFILSCVGSIHPSDVESSKKKLAKKIKGKDASGQDKQVVSKSNMRTIVVPNKGQGTDVVLAVKADEERPYIRSYFSPGILEVLRIYISHEQKQVYTAVYRLTHNDIAQDLIKKHTELTCEQTKYPVRVIVEKKFTDDWCIPLHAMIKAGIPVRCNKQRYNDSNGFEIMHHKFVIFKKNKKDKSLLVTGSFNFTGQAHKNNWENILVTDDADAIHSFFEQFKELNNNHSREITLQECHSDKDKQRSYARKMNNIP